MVLVLSPDHGKAAKAQEPATTDITNDEGAEEAGGEVAGASGVGTTSLLVSTTECFLSGCTEVDAILRYSGSTGAYQGVHVPSINDPWGMAIEPIRESLLVVSRTDSTVREYDARTGAFVRVLVSPGAEGLHSPQGIALTSNGRLFVASNQTSGQLSKFNGVLEFSSITGAFIGELIDGGSSLSETCPDPICLRGPNHMTVGPNGRLYVISAINDSILEYTVNGTFQGAFTSVRLIGPGGFVIRPPGTVNAGNLLATSRYINPSNDFDDTIVEFSGITLVSTNGGVLAGSMIRPGPLAWHTDGHLLVGERSGEIPPGYADRVSKRNGASGSNLGLFTPSGDTNTHQVTALLHVHINYATDDSDADGDTDLKDLAAFQNCFASSTSSACLTPFDDNRTGSIGRWDFLAFLGNMHGPRRPCTTASQCVDGNPCSTASCVSGFCRYASVADGTACPDSLFCNGSETCQAGVCRGKSPCASQAHCNESTDTCRQCLVNSECNDNNQCTDDTCTASFTCQFTAHTRTCNDGNICTTNDRCNAGACVGGPPPNCNDNNVCTTDTCDPVLGCIHTDNLLPCDDGSACTLQDFCLQGTCRAGRNRDCDDDNSCTTDSCNAVTGCVHLNRTGSCDDDNPCTDNDACAAGVCVGTPKNCSDSVPCTVDRCVNGLCENVPENSRCSNGDWCDGTEICDAVLGCLPGTPPCEDNIACTVDGCNPDEQTCTHTPNHALCSNGLFCDGAEQCSPTLGCVPGTPPDCDDQIDCTIDDCDNQAGECVHAPDDDFCEDNNVCTDNFCGVSGCEVVFNTDPCNDGMLCTINDVCANGTCAGTPVECPPGEQCDAADGQCKACLENADCNDNNVCTTDTCNAGVCTYTPNSQSCNDGRFCTAIDTCSGGECVGSGDRCPGQLCNETTDSCVQCLSASDCNDNNICTDNVCSSGTCQYPPNTVPCPDGLFCNGNEVCGGGVCQPGTPPNCSDGVGCTTDTCNETTDSCDHTPHNAACDDTLFCTGVETCHVTLGCQPGTPPVCDDGVPCTIDTCDPGLDECLFTPDDDSCDDGQFCNGTETCHATAGCQNGTPPDCSSLNGPCTNGVCDETSDACVAQPKPLHTPCDDGQHCTVGDSCNATGSCSINTPRDCSAQSGPCTDGVCDEANDACVAQPKPLHTPCDDGQHCTVGDSCNATGSCSINTPRDCSAQNGPCTDGVCNETTDQCVAQPVTNGSPCDDGLFCTVNDSCLNGSCSVTDPRDCSGLDGTCEEGVCDDNLNQCVAQPVTDGTPCDDEQFCTTNDACQNGVCDGDATCPDLCDEINNTCIECETVNDCVDDGNPCTDLACVSGSCQFTHNDNVCDDGLYCTVSDQCSGGTCTGQPRECSSGLAIFCDENRDACVECLVNADCDDGNLCTDDVCNDGVCFNYVNGEPCNDGLFCTINDQCMGGTCTGSPNDCSPGEFCDETLDACVECVVDGHCPDDGNPCTDAACINSACQHVPNTDLCDDGLVCTENDQCSNGNCVGDALSCDDGIACTIDTCEEPTGCVHTPDHGACDDGAYCTGEEACDVFTGCTTTGDPCSPPTAVCDEANDVCVECLIDQDCPDDGLFCNGNEICVAGVCDHEGDPCEVGQACTEGVGCEDP
jgi:hypothetical protein